MAAHDEEDGFVLIPVLAIVLVFVMVSAGMAARSRLLVLQETNRVRTVALGAAVDGFTRLAALDIAGPAARLVPDGSPQHCRLRDMDITVSATDQDMLLDLNGASLPMLVDVLTATGLATDAANVIANQIVDFRDPDDASQPLFGAERFEYQRAGLAWGPRNGYFADTMEIAQLPAVTPVVLARIEPLLTIYSGRAAIDVASGGPVAARIDSAAQGRVERWQTPSRRSTFGIVVEAAIKGRATFARSAIVAVTEGKAPRFLRWARPSPREDVAPVASVESSGNERPAPICALFSTLLPPAAGQPSS
ncbi:type II secretion system protein GspK [Rhizobium sp. NFR03]|uniref:type II secretion system protein GspK n=1 Tax=Rhizobium sp. NFR03 TaxID=1566263 RepID=UPI00147A7331|nr:type II secretion system protein GspK [Rhizobium sp. NFR03]